MTESLFFAHANGIPGGSYAPLGKRLQAAGYAWQAIDRIAHDPAFPPGSWYRQADEILHTIETSLQPPVHMIGHSMGAVLGFIAAWRRPELFRSLTMLDPPLIMRSSGLLYAMAAWLPRQEWRDQFTPAGRSRHRRRVWPDREQARAYFASKPLYAAFDAECFAAFVDSAVAEADDGSWHLRFDPTIEVELFRHTPYNLDCYLRRLRVPGSLVRGTTSPVTRASYAHALARRHGLQEHEQPGGHMFPLEDADACAQQLLRLLRQY